MVNNTASNYLRSIGDLIELTPQIWSSHSNLTRRQLELTRLLIAHAIENSEY